MTRSMYATLVAALALASSYGCGDDTTKSGDAGHDAALADAASDTDAATGKDAATANDAATGKDAATPIDAGDDSGSPGVTQFHVTASNLTLTLQGEGGVEIEITFPASAAGKDITVELLDPTSVTWANPAFKTAFSQVLDLGPDGTTFADPVKVTLSDGSLFAFNFSDPAGVGEPLALSSDGKSLLLTHFSALAVLPPQGCDSVGGWSDTPNGQGCTGATSVYRYFTAKCYSLCYTVQAGCCVDPSVTTDPNDGCDTGAPSVSINYQRSGTNGGAYPYCADGLPTVTDVTGSLVADGTSQMITVTGTNFDANGSIYINLDVLIPTQRSSATSAVGIIPAGTLIAAGNLTGIGYINPQWNAAGPCNANNLGNCDFSNKSTPGLSEPIAAPPGPSCMSGGTLLSPSTGTGTCANPYRIDLRTMAVGAVGYHGITQSLGADESVPGATACGISSTARDVVYSVRVPTGADLDVSVDAAAGENPVIFGYEGASCTPPLNACANDGVSGACDAMSMVRADGDFFGTEVYVSVSEETNTAGALTARFALRGAVTFPTLVSINPTSATAGSYAMITATTSGGSGWNASAYITNTSGVFQEAAFCDPTTDDTCDFTLPVTLSAGTYNVALRFDDLAGTPMTNTVTLTVN